MVNRKNFDRKKWLSQYKNYLNNVRGLSPNTQRVYLLIATRFLESLEGKGRWVNWSKLTAAAIIEFVQSDSAPRTGSGPNTTVSSTRSFLRFLISQGLVEAGIEAVVPTIRAYKHSTLPSFFSEADIMRLLEATKGDIKKYMPLLLVSRLGLRIEEVANLTLDDIDWRTGFIVIRAGKNRCERKLPLARDLAESLLNYLRQRPKVDDRHIFLQVKPPHKAYDGPTLGRVINRFLVRFGMSGGSHRFRHAAATQMVNRGASFKTVADLLGHQSLSSTAIYAKLDLESLAKIALPWPGGNA